MNDPRRPSVGAPSSDPVVIKARLAAIVESSADAILAKDTRGIVTAWNPAAERLYGFSADEIIGRSVMAIVPPDLVDEFDYLLVQVLEGRDVPAFDTQRLTKDGDRIPVSITVSPIRDATGAVVGASTVARDITDRLAAERERAWNAQLVEQSADAIVALDAEGLITMWNRAAEQLFGVPASVAIGRLPHAVVQSGNPEEQVGLPPSVLRDGETVHYEVTRKHRDGRDLTVQVSAAPLHHPDGSISGAVVSVRDVTEVRRAEQVIADAAAREARLERELEQTRRLETIGQLAGGVAHDFNNLLAVIMNLAHFVGAELPAGSPLRADVDEIELTAQRAATLTRQLLIFSRRDVVTVGVLDPRPVVDDLYTLLARAVGEGVELAINHSADLWNVSADRGQLEQVVMNLVVNARDAMPGGGRIVIETRNTLIDEAYAQARAGLAAGAYVTLTVSDTGSGMSADVVERAFEPFFTRDAGGADLVLHGGTVIDALITDVILPGESGVQLAARLRTSHSQLPVLYTSGYSNALLTGAQMRQRTTAFLEKPFTAHDLQGSLRGLLDSPR